MTPKPSPLRVVLSLLIALLLTLLPMPDWAIWLRPAWVLLVVMYWVLFYPQSVNVGTAWIAGLFLDLLNGTLLGEHALAMTCAVAVVAKMHTRLRMFPLLQQTFSIFLIILLYQIIIYGVQGFLGQLPRSLAYWSSSFTSMLLWPWIVGFLQDISRHRRTTG